MTGKVIDLEALHDELMEELLESPDWSRRKNPALPESHCVVIIRRDDHGIVGAESGPMLEVLLPDRFVVGVDWYFRLAGMIKEQAWAFAVKRGLKPISTRTDDPSRGKSGRWSIFVGARSW